LQNALDQCTSQKLIEAVDLLDQIGRALELTHPPRFEGLHPQELLSTFRDHRNQLQTQIVVAALRTGAQHLASEAFDLYWAEDLEWNAAATRLQALYRGKSVRGTTVAAEPAAAKAAVTFGGGGKGFVRRKDLRGDAERAIFQFLSSAVQAAAHQSPEDIERAIRSGPVQIAELPLVLGGLMNWLCGLTQGLSVYIFGRIIARRREHAQAMAAPSHAPGAPAATAAARSHEHAPPRRQR